MSNISFVKLATNSDNTAVFAGNDKNDNLVIICAALYAGATAPVPPSTFVADSAGNQYNLVDFFTNLHDAVSNTYISVAVYVTQAGAIQTGAANTFSNPFVGTGATALWTYGIEYASPYSTFALDVDAKTTGHAAPFTLNAGTVVAGNDDLMMTLAIDLALGNTGNITFTSTFAPSGIFVTTGPTDGASVALGFKEASVSLGTQNLIANVNNGTATAVFAYTFAFKGVNVPASGNNLIFSLSKGPDPVTPLEGRAIATVVIDTTQMNWSVIDPNLGIAGYPEFTFSTLSPADTWKNFLVYEFDLESVGPQLARLSQVRTIVAYSRPFFGATSFGLNSDCPDIKRWGIAFLTNTSTQQTIVLGGDALRAYDSLDTSMTFADIQQVQMPANKGAMKFRFLAVNMEASPVGRGKYTINFYNYELPGAYSQVQAIGRIN